MTEDWFWMWYQKFLSEIRTKIWSLTSVSELVESVEFGICTLTLRAEYVVLWYMGLYISNNNYIRPKGN